MECMKYKIFEKFGDISDCTTAKSLSLPYSGSLALHTGEEAEKIAENRNILKNHFPETASFVSLSQVHGDNIADITEKRDIGWQNYDETYKADAIVTAVPQIVITILTADCVPILLYDPAKKVIAAVHAGWRGSESRIVHKTVEYMKKRYGCESSDIVAAIGPSIGGCCYEVDDAVASKFTDYKDSVVKTSGNQYMLDLKSVNRQQLLDNGLEEMNIEVSSVCTACDNERFFSYRKDGGCTGRFISAIMLK